jgi:hypothetical protein
MMVHKERLIFLLTVAPGSTERREKEYKIFDGEPSFFKLSKKEKKDFINGEIIKVKEFLDKEYRQDKRQRAF